MGAMKSEADKRAKTAINGSNRDCCPAPRTGEEEASAPGKEHLLLLLLLESGMSSEENDLAGWRVEGDNLLSSCWRAIQV